MAERTPKERLESKAERGFRGYPIGTIAFYGQDNRCASKGVVGIAHAEREPVREMEKWFSEVSMERAEAFASLVSMAQSHVGRRS